MLQNLRIEIDDMLYKLGEKQTTANQSASNKRNAASFNDVTLLTRGLDQVLPRNAAVALNQTVAKSEGNMRVANLDFR